MDKESKARVAPEESERLAILGEVFAEATHEINNILQAIVGYAHVQLYREERTEHVPGLRKIADLAQEAAKLTKNVLRFFRTSTGTPGDVEKAVERTLGLFSYRTANKQGVRTIWNPSSPLPPVVLPTEDLQLVLVNLIKNAMDALEGSPSRVIRLTVEMGAGSLTLKVWDSGPPIPSDVLPHIFDPLFTTKSPDKGTGLGLAVARRLVRNVGGEITATNPEGGGVLFALALPLAPPMYEKEPSTAPSSASRLQGMRVLVVDDDDSVRAVLRLIVADEVGALVSTCASGEEALRLLGQQTFDVVLLDLRMPGLSGQEVYRSLPQALQERVVFVTGDTVGASTREFLATSERPALLKPVEIHPLLEAMQQVVVQSGYS